MLFQIYNKTVMYLIIDNTKNLDKAYMTPLLIKILNKLFIHYLVLSEVSDVDEVICNTHQYNIEGIIISGGPLCLSKDSISDTNKNLLVLNHFKDIPILGICFGFQVMSYFYGSSIEQMPNEKKNLYKIKLINTDKSQLFKNITNNKFIVFQSHKDFVKYCPKDFIITSIDPNDNVIQAIESTKLNRYGVQFHPEGLKHSEIVIKNFINICRLNKNKP